MKSENHLTLEEATKFFSHLFYGQHHLPSGGVIPFGNGFLVKNKQDLSTYDGNLLTRFVLKCHDECIRGEIRGHKSGISKIIIWKRQGREGDIFSRHPTIEKAIENFRNEI